MNGVYNKKEGGTYPYTSRFLSIVVEMRYTTRKKMVSNIMCADKYSLDGDKIDGSFVFTTRSETIFWLGRQNCEHHGS